MQTRPWSGSGELIDYFKTILGKLFFSAFAVPPFSYRFVKASMNNVMNEPHLTLKIEYYTLDKSKMLSYRFIVT